MRKWYIIGFLLTTMGGVPGILPAQTRIADSLFRELKTAPPDTHRVSLLTNAAWEINEMETDRAEQCLWEAIQLAQTLGFPPGEAMAWNGLGAVEENRGNYRKAHGYYVKALAMREQIGDRAPIAASYNNLGLFYETMGRTDSALLFLRRSVDIMRELNNPQRTARTLFNIAALYNSIGAFDEAQTNLQEARVVLESLGDKDGIAKVYTEMGHLRFDLDQFKEARKMYEKALSLREQLDDSTRLAQALTDYANVLDELDSSNVALAYYYRALGIFKQLKDAPGQGLVFLNLGNAYKHVGDYTKALAYLDSALVYTPSDDKSIIMEAYNTIGDTYGRAGRLDLAMQYTQRYMAIARENNDTIYIKGAYKDFAEIYAAQGDFEKAYMYRLKFDELEKAVFNDKIATSFAQKEALFEDRKKQEEIERQQREIAERDAKIERDTLRTYALGAGLLAAILLAALFYNSNRLRARANRELAAKNATIEQERTRADALLRNILPEKTAEELKQRQRVQPVRYESVTVLFTDFKDFTRIAEALSPEQLVDELDACFRLFDSIVEQHGLEKIKTIGDAYMCAAGLPEPNDTHPFDAVRAALAMQSGLNTLMTVRRAEGRPVFDMRIGIHTGPVVAGVVGSHKFAYDIWGDTVNTAARLEQTGEPGKINISETVYQMVKNEFPCRYRGMLAAKNKGEIAMYFVEKQTL